MGNNYDKQNGGVNLFVDILFVIILFFFLFSFQEGGDCSFGSRFYTYFKNNYTKKLSPQRDSNPHHVLRNHAS